MIMPLELERGIEQMQDWLNLHKTVEITYNVDHYMITLLYNDGNYIATTATGTTLQEAIERIGTWSGSIPR